jgi:NADPH:quinone reductase-like Zn-dependent oxidoreductase
MRGYHANSGGCLPHNRERPSNSRTSPGEVLVRVQANSLNARELLVLKGTYPLPVEPDVVKPIIDRVFSFDDVLDAFRYDEAGNAFGKVVISQHRKSGNA